MSAHGIEAYASDGTTKRITFTTVGGAVFVERISTTTTTVQTITYPKIASGAYLLLYRLGYGMHAVSTGTNGSGQATITITPDVNDGGAQETILLVFTKFVNEPDYGINYINDNGDRVISSEYPIPQLIGYLPSPTVFDWGVNYDGYRKLELQYSLAGFPADAILMTSLPVSSGDTWYHNVGEANNSTYISVYTKEGSVSLQLPVISAYRASGQQNSTDQHGIRIWQGSPSYSLVYDSGMAVMNLHSISTGVTIASDPGGTIASFTSSVPVAVTPSCILPRFYCSVTTTFPSTVRYAEVYRMMNLGGYWKLECRLQYMDTIIWAF